MERLRALDAEFLHLEDGVNHMHIGACAEFEGPPPSDHEVDGLFRAAVAAIPRYRQRVQEVPLQLGRPVWVDDDGFDLADHVFRTRLPTASDEALQSLVGGIMSTELDRGRPLWEAWIVDGLADDRWALVAKVHHCLVDGIAGVGLMYLLLSDRPEPAPEPGAVPGWEVARPPTSTRLVAEAVGELARSAVRTGRDVVGGLRDPSATVDRLRALARGTAGWLAELRPTAPVSIDGPVSAERRWTWVDAPLADAKAIRADRGGTVNDVVLAVITQGFRELLLSRGEDPRRAELRTLVPVSVRTDDGALDNEVSAVVAELPVAVVIPELRYEAVRQEMGRLKASMEAEAGEALTSLADLTPPPLMAYGTRAVLGLLRRQRNINTVTTNVPGPQFPLYAAGRRLLAYRPYVPVALGVKVTVAILSYDGTLSFGLTGDESTTDLDVLAKGITAGFDELR